MNTASVKKFVARLLIVAALPMFAGFALWGQQQSGNPPQQPPAQPPQQVPDAPSAVKKPAPPPSAVPAEPPANSVPAAMPAESPAANPGEQPNLVPHTPPPPAQPLPNGSEARDQLASTFRVNISYVMVPVTVKDRDGNLVEGLEKQDFAVYENGIAQNLSFFSSDPFPISAAVIIDADLPAGSLEKVQKTLPAMMGAFGQTDEVGIWIFGNTFKKLQDFTAAADTSKLDETIKTLRDFQGLPPDSIGTGPINGPPVINGRPVDPRSQNVYNPPQQPMRQSAKVLNDVMVAAAQERNRRNRANHRILFVISDGKEKGSRVSYADVLRVLNSDNITVFGVAVGGPGTPVIGSIEKLPIPKIGGANVLNKYASATGGDTFDEFNQRSIESAYSILTQEARNQYTLAYASHNAPATAFRDIEVKVHRPGCENTHSENCVRVYTREGYYPAPPPRQ